MGEGARLGLGLPAESAEEEELRGARGELPPPRRLVEQPRRLEHHALLERAWQRDVTPRCKAALLDLPGEPGNAAPVAQQRRRAQLLEQLGTGEEEEEGLEVVVVVMVEAVAKEKGGRGGKQRTEPHGVAHAAASRASAHRWSAPLEAFQYGHSVEM